MDKELDLYYKNEMDRYRECVEKGEKFKQKPFIRIFKQERNEPCPCGSGKKFKKCCLNEVR